MQTWKYDAARIPVAREVRDVSRRELAVLIGATTNQVGEWENGDKGITVGSLLKISNALQVHPKFFFAVVDDDV